MESVFQKLPIGIEGFEKVRAENFYYVDKTEFIKELLENWGDEPMGHSYSNHHNITVFFR